MPDHLGQSVSRLTFERFRDEMRRHVRDDVPDEALRELWDMAREAGRRAAASVGAEPEHTPRGRNED